MRFRVISCWLFRAVFRTSTFSVMCVLVLPPFLLYSILLLQRMDSSLPFPPTHLPNTNRFNRWGVTLRDTLNTMYIMGRDDDFEDAIGLWGILLSLCRPYVLPTFSLSLLPFHFSPSSLLPSSSSPLPSSHLLHLPDLNLPTHVPS